ncbi:hypothetical protein SLS57_002876 [Botryosphaeria dothidea]
MRRTSTWSQSSDSSSAVRNVRIFHGESDNTTRGRAVLDTGASANFISKDMASKLQVQQQGYRGQLVSAANGSPVRTNSTMTLDWYFIGFENLYKDQFLVAEDLQSDIIIGMKTLQKRELLYWNEKLCVLTFERLSKDEKKTQDEAEAKKAEKNKEDEEKRLQEKIKKAKQGRG